MTPATLTRPPFEEEVRAAIEAAAAGPIGEVVDDIGNLRAALRSLALEAGRYLAESARQTKEGGDGLWEPMSDPLPGCLWGDLRPSEAERLTSIIHEAAYRAADRSMAVILDELTAAGLAFAAEHPDAPRGKPGKGAAA